MRALLERWAPWLAVAVLVAGVAAYTATRLTGGGVHAAVASRPVPLEAVERQVASEFVRTAVARRDLAAAWALVTPELRHGMTLREWKTGTIPVVPHRVAGVPLKLSTVTSYSDRAALDVLLGGDAFRLDLARVGGRWLVAAWAPVRLVHP